MRALGKWSLQEIPVDPEINMLTVDVECWHQIMYRKLTGKLIAPSHETVQSTQQVLEVLKRRNVSATFFVLGYVAEAFPDLVKEIAGEGHEIAAHGYSHIPLSRLTPEAAREDIGRSIDLLSELTGRPIQGFRAAEFSIVRENLDSLEVLAELGLKYDSSIFPIVGPRYGINDFPLSVTKMRLGTKSLVEVPPSAVRLVRRNVPVAGGGYFRLLPYRILRRAVRMVNHDGRPAVVYTHPYEIGLQRLRTGLSKGSITGVRGLGVELKFNLFRGAMRDKLDALLDEFRFSSIEKVLGNVIEE